MLIHIHVICRISMLTHINGMCGASMLIHIHVMCRISMLTHINGMCGASMLIHINGMYRVSVPSVYATTYLLIAARYRIRRAESTSSLANVG